MYIVLHGHRQGVYEHCTHQAKSRYQRNCFVTHMCMNAHGGCEMSFDMEILEIIYLRHSTATDNILLSHIMPSRARRTL